MFPQESCNTTPCNSKNFRYNAVINVMVGYCKNIWEMHLRNSIICFNFIHRINYMLKKIYLDCVFFLQ